MLVLHRDARVVSFLPQVPRRRHNSLGNARLLLPNSAGLSPQDARNVIIRTYARSEGFAEIEIAGRNSGIRSHLRRSFSSMSELNDLAQLLVSSGVLDLTFAFEMMVATVANAKLVH